MPSTYVAGVDSSTQSCKATVHDLATGEVVRTGRASHPSGTEVDPEAWWSALQQAIADAGGVDDVAAISIAAQQHGLVALDGRGRAVRDALLWNDVRSADAAAALAAEIGAEEYSRRVGVVPVASFTGPKLRWLREHESANADAVAAVVLPHDWLSWRLRGYGPVGASELGPDLDELATDRSDASGTAYWGASSGEYDLDLIERAFGRVPILPRVLGPAERMGVTRGGSVVGAGLGDNAGGALGLGAAPGDAVISIGTSGTVFAVSDRPLSDPTGVVAGFADGTGNYLPLVATLNAARVLDSVAGLLGVDHVELARLAMAAAPGADGLVLQPYFEGERTPNRPDATATLFGMSLASTRRETLARAAVEGLLCGLADGLDAIRRCGVPAGRILLIGGAARNPAVSQIAAQVFDVPVVVPGIDEAVARGAALQAGWALTGELPSWTDGDARSFAVDHRPIIREQYVARA
ncbi:xylulokinase [Microbacterium sp. MYb62]|uniref:xylulokinase n=1 Tax=Microbacterium sp. MYb62 TaxID=1848690 RepID=UPI000CFB1C77|nr:FGGY family carbohydrate kinase [Microbacterium sp. MYb62]PRB17188.1 xylulose kinase [Microbacterium sp. MYb62]